MRSTDSLQPNPLPTNGATAIPRDENAKARRRRVFGSADQYGQEEHQTRTPTQPGKRWLRHRCASTRIIGQNTSATQAAMPTEIVDQYVNNAVRGATTFAARPLRIGIDTPVNRWRRHPIGDAPCPVQ